MPDLLDSADPRRGSGEVVPSTSYAVPSANGGAHTAAAPPSLRTEYSVLSTAPLLLFEQVSKWYGPVLGVNQVTLELRPGITGLVGHNGAGKSTLLRLATGQLRPDLG